MADSRAEQVHVSPTALAQTSALLTEDRDERTAQARQTTRKRLLNTTDLFEQLRKLTGSGASGISPLHNAQSGSPASPPDVYSLRRCIRKWGTVWFLCFCRVSAVLPPLTVLYTFFGINLSPLKTLKTKYCFTRDATTERLLFGLLLFLD